MPEPMEAAAITGAERRIIGIIDDDPSMLTGVGRLLSAHGFLAVVYPSAEAFLECAAASEACCLVLDINLGGISGIELRRRLEADGSTLPVIFMSAADCNEIEREAVEAGCVAYLRKPFPPCQLIDAIDKAVRV